jgi:hypothetical protein
MASVREQLALLDNPQLTRTVKIKGNETQLKIRPWWFANTEGIVLAPKFGCVR